MNDKKHKKNILDKRALFLIALPFFLTITIIALVYFIGMLSVFCIIFYILAPDTLTACGITFHSVFAILDTLKENQATVIKCAGIYYIPVSIWLINKCRKLAK